MQHFDSIPLPPPPTEIPDYVWSPRYDRPIYLPGKPVQKPKEEGRLIPHPDAETALRAAKKACCKQRGRWLGRESGNSDFPVFLVFENGNVIERHIVGR